MKHSAVPSAASASLSVAASNDTIASIEEQLMMLRGALRSTGLMVAEDAHFGTASDLGYLILMFADRVESIQEMVGDAFPATPAVGRPQV